MCHAYVEMTMEHCAEKSILFHNLDEFQQTLILRSQANLLRSKCNLPAYEMIYDPLDATEIVNQLAGEWLLRDRARCSDKRASECFKNDYLLCLYVYVGTAVGKKYGLEKDADEIVKSLNEKYGGLLKNVAGLRGATQIIELAIGMAANLPWLR